MKTVAGFPDSFRIGKLSLNMLKDSQHTALIKEALDLFKATDTIEKQYYLLRDFLNTDICKKELIYLRRHLVKK